jgi:carbamoyl-phosphate synthase small subunit
MSVLKLSNGLLFKGISFGAEIVHSIYGEVVFTTSMVGYPESCTDPSYKQQILVFTQPLIGNYGVPGNSIDDFGLSKYFESDKIQVTGVIVADVANKFSHWNAKSSFGNWLKSQGVYGISGIDTRQLVSVLRDEGTMLGSIANSEADAIIGDDFQNVNMIQMVSKKDIKVYNPNGSLKILLIGKLDFN